ncbi:MAG: hypothetical protein ACPG4U_11930 [Pseudomonadales bacterium]
MLIDSILKRHFLKVCALCVIGFFPALAQAFQCSLYEGQRGNIPTFVSEIAELKNLDKNGRHIKLLIPAKGAVEEFDLEQYVSRAKTRREVVELLKEVEGSVIVYIDLFEAQKRYEVRIGTLTTNVQQVIEQTVYANFAYNLQHNEVYDLQNNIAVFCN